MLLLLLMAVGTMAENYRLPLTVIPHNYTISLVPYFEERNFTFDGEVAITVTAITDSNKITLHYDSLDIVKTPTVTSTDDLHVPQVVETTYDNETNFYTLFLNENLIKGRKYDIEISYLGYIQDSCRGFYRCSYRTDTEKRWFAVTSFEPGFARYAFPCFDEPALKAKFKIKIARYANYEAVSNMPRISISAPDPELDGKIWDIFDETPPMSTYLVAFMVSDLKKLSTADERYSIWATDTTVHRANYTLALTQRVLKFMENYTGVEYNLPKLDSVAEPCYNGGMENWGFIVYQAWEVLQNDYSSVFLEKNLEDMVVHEMAHMWFGNLVTPTWWDELWLKEGFARYFETLITAQLRPEWRKDEQFVVNVQQNLLFHDERESYPIIHDVGHTRDFIIYISIHYDKGAAVVRMMAHFLTHETLQKGLRAYFKTHAFGVANATDMYQIMEEAQREDKILPDGISVKTVMDSWTLQDSYPILHISRTQECIHIRQEPFVRPGDVNNTMEKLWWIPISYTTSANIDFTNTQPNVWMDGVSQITLHENLTESQWIMFNLQASGLYRVNYDTHTWKLIIDYMNSAEFQQIHVVNRAQLLDDAFFLVKFSFLNITTFLDLTLYLIRETDYIPWATFFIFISRFDEDLKGSDIYDSFRHYVLVLMKKLYESASQEEQATDSLITKMTRANVLFWTCYLGYTPCIKWATSHYNAWLSNPTNTTLSLDLKIIVYCTALSKDEAVHWQDLWDVFVAHNMSTELLYTLGYFQCAENYKDMAKQYHNLTLFEPETVKEEIDIAGNAVRGGMKSVFHSRFNKQFNYTHSTSGNLLDEDFNLQPKEKSDSDDFYIPLPPEIYKTMKKWLVNFERHYTLS